MKRSEVKDFIPLLQAWADGKTIQTRGFGPDGYGCWVDVTDRINTDESLCMYRIKPEPREFYLHLRRDNRIMGMSEEIPKDEYDCFGEKYERIKVREVTE